MGRILFVCAILFSHLALASQSAYNINDIKRRCTKPTGPEPVVYSDDYKWGVTMDEMAAEYKKMYNSDKRLALRAYYNRQKDSVVIPLDTPDGPKEVKLGQRFLRSVTLDVENALKRGYAKYVFFPDMGHAHAHIPEAYYQKVLAPIPVKQQDKAYELMLNYPGTRFLYHLAEQLKMVDKKGHALPERYLQWRLYTRSMVGDNKAQGTLDVLFDKDSKYNTAHGEPGYHYWGAGFIIHSDKNGCFAYHDGDKTRYFDLSLKDLAPQNSGGM